MGHDKDEKQPTITLTQAQFDALMARGGGGGDAIVQLVEAMQRRNPGALDITGMSAARQEQLVKKHDGTGYRKVPVKGEGTGVALVQAVPGFANGKIVQVLDYKPPPGAWKHVSQGGLVPDGMQIHKDDAAKLTIQLIVRDGGEPPLDCCDFLFRQWFLESFYRTDVTRAWVGKNLAAHFCDLERGQGLATPWEDGVKADESRDAAE